MRELSLEQRELIDAVLSEGDSNIINLTPSLLEKDVHLTEALRLIFRNPPSDLTPVFCGGTSLSKAYRLIERMSEDADIKLVPSADFLAQSKTQQQRRLSQYKEEIQQAFRDAGFTIHQLKAQNENRYIRFDLEYNRVYDFVSGLRPHVQIEFITKSTRLDCHQQAINSLIHQAVKREEGSLNVQTQDLAETLAEKVLSFLRRYAQHRAGALRQDWDIALVRHLYDVHQIQSNQPSTIEQSRQVFRSMTQEEGSEWGSQFPEFEAAPASVMLSALNQAETDEELRNQYQSNLLPLIYSPHQPSFDAAFNTFKGVAYGLLKAL